MLVREVQALAALGWQMFALNPDGTPWGNCERCRDGMCEHPLPADCPCLLCHGAWAGTSDPDRLAAMWDLNPESLIGVHCGPASGIVLLDFDRHSEERDGLAAMSELSEEGLLPRTTAAASGGGGFHYFYRYPEGAEIRNNNRGRVAPGVDVKSTGGFAVVAPSRKRGRSTSYSWVLDPWACPPADLNPKMLKRMTEDAVVSQQGFRVDLSRYGLQNFQRSADRVRDAGRGSRNDRLYEAARRAAEAVYEGLVSVAEAEATLLVAAEEAGLRDREARATIRSGLRSGLSALSRSSTL